MAPEAAVEETEQATTTETQYPEYADAPETDDWEEAPSAEGESEETPTETPATPTEGEETPTEEPAAPEEPETPEAPKPAAEQWDEQLVNAARQIGIPDNVIQAFGNNQALANAIWLIDSQRTAYERQYGQQQPQQQQPPQTPQQAAKYAFQWGEDGDYDPQIRQNMEGFAAHLEQRLGRYEQLLPALGHHLQQLYGVVQAQESHQQRQAARDFQERTDRWVSGLGTEYEPLLGKGRRDDLPADSEARRNRDQLEQQMNVLAHGYWQTGQQVNEETLRQQALNVVFGDRAKELARKEINQQLRNRQGQFTNRPTSRKSGTNRDPHAAAVAVARKFLSDVGYGESSDDLAGTLME